MSARVVVPSACLAAMRHAAVCRLAATTAAIVLAACGGGDARPAVGGDGAASRDTGPVLPGGITAGIIGAGATFPYPVYARWFNAYAARTGTYINYQSVGSGDGVRQLAQGVVDFAATDSPLPQPQLSQEGAAPVLYIPLVLGAVAVAYNLPEVAVPLRFDAATLAGIFAGQVTRWDAPVIAKLNPGLRLPPRPIVVVHRGDSSGTGDALSRWLAGGSPAWARRVAGGATTRWPVGIAARGNEGVAAQVKQSVGALGFVEATYAAQSRLPVALLRNRAGAFVAPTVEGMTAAARAVSDTLAPNADLRVSLLDAAGPASYPITTFSWVLVRRALPDSSKAARLRDFLHWAVASGGPDARALGYAPLPETMRARVAAQIDGIRAEAARR